MARLGPREGRATGVGRPEEGMGGLARSSGCPRGITAALKYEQRFCPGARVQGAQLLELAAGGASPQHQLRPGPLSPQGPNTLTHTKTLRSDSRPPGFTLPRCF